MHCRSGVASFIKIEYETCELVDGESALTNYPLHFLKNIKVREVAKIKKIKKTMTSQDFLVEGWSIEGCITKVVEWIVMNVGFLILHKTKVLVL